MLKSVQNYIINTRKLKWIKTFYPYIKTKEIVNNHDEFENYKLINSRGEADNITFQEYCNDLADYEGSFRNETIEKNVLKYHKENPAKRLLY